MLELHIIRRCWLFSYRMSAPESRVINCVSWIAELNSRLIWRWNEEIKMQKNSLYHEIVQIH